VIPREGVERLKVFAERYDHRDVIPREGVERKRAENEPETSRPVRSVIPREGVESHRLLFQQVVWVCPL